MSIFTHTISCFTISNLPWFMNLTILGSYAILFFIASDFTFTTRHIDSWVSFPLWPRLFILSAAISPLFPSGILNTYQLGGSYSGVISFCFFILFIDIYTIYRSRLYIYETICKKLYDNINFSRGMKVIKEEPNKNIRTENIRRKIKNSIDWPNQQTT